MTILWGLSNIAAGTKSQAQAVLSDSKLVGYLLHFAEEETTEALYSIFNAVTSVDLPAAKKFYEVYGEELIIAISDLVEKSSAKSLNLVVEALEVLLKLL